MTVNIHQILNQLGTAIETQIGDALSRASIAEAQNERLIEGLRALIVPKGANDNGTPGVAAASPELGGDGNSRANMTPAKRLNISDETYIAVLTTDWSRAADIRKRLAADGITVAEGTIYNRLRKLVGEHPQRVETVNGPERWRLKAAATNGSGVTPTGALPKAAVKHALKIVSSAPARVAQTLPDLPQRAMLPQLHHGECIEVMRSIPDHSVDLVLCDLPYGTTRKSFDPVIDLEAIWREYRRIIKPQGNIVLFGCQPFTNALINAAPDLFKYSLVWDKGSVTGFPQASCKLMKAHEDILVFSPGTNIKRSKRQAVYNPQGVVYVRRKQPKPRKASHLEQMICGGKGEYYEAMTNCPRSILSFAKVKGKSGAGQHPFAKPVDLLEYFIRTYSHLGSIVLDNTMGGGSTMIAAMQTGRQGIGIEIDAQWYAKACQSVASKQELLSAQGVQFASTEICSDIPIVAAPAEIDFANDLRREDAKMAA